MQLRAMLRALAPHSVAAEGAIPLGGGLLGPALEGALQMKPRVPLGQIDAIDVYSFKEFVDTLDSPFPTNLIDAQFNARFLIASAFVADDLNDALREPDFASPAIRALFAKIRVHHEPAFDVQHRADMSIPTRVVLRRADGSRHETLLAEPLGSHRRAPISPEATRAKFNRRSRR